MPFARRVAVPKSVVACPNCGGRLIVHYDGEEDYSTGKWYAEFGVDDWINCDICKRRWHDNDDIDNGNDKAMEAAARKAFMWLATQED